MTNATSSSAASGVFAQLPPAVRELYPFTSHYLAVKGGRLHYIDESPRAAAAVSAQEHTQASPVQGGSVQMPPVPERSAREHTPPPVQERSAREHIPPPVPEENAQEERLAQGRRQEWSALGRKPEPPVLMLHGNPTWSFFYRNVVRALVAKGRRCIVPDHIGCGLSDKPQSGFGYTLEENISNVLALIEHLQLREFDLIVHDWGGAIGMGVATRLPQCVRRIVILNTAAFISQDIPARIALCRVPLLGEWIVRGLNGFAWPATFMAVSRKPLKPEVKQGFLFPYGSWRDRIATHRFVKAIPLKPTHENYPTLAAIEADLSKLNKKPKLLLWGGKDFCFNDRFYKRWQTIYPDAQQRYIADAGHYVLEDAREESVTAITDFLCAAEV